MPPYLPWHRELVYISGVAEVVLGTALWLRRRRAIAAWGLIALLVAVFPANVHMALHPVQFPMMPPLALTNATFGSARSTTIRVTKRLGVNGVSMRVNVTAAAGPSTFVETKRRPKLVAAQSVPPSAGARSAAIGAIAR